MEGLSSIMTIIVGLFIFKILSGIVFKIITVVVVIAIVMYIYNGGFDVSTLPTIQIPKM